MGSRRVFRCAILQAGEILRSDEEFGDLTKRGTSGALWKDMALVVSRNELLW